MKNNDLLSFSTMKPKKQTVDYLLRFSKSLAVLETPKKRFLVSKN